MKRCGKCGARKPLDAFGPDRSKPSGLRSYCRSCAVASATVRNRSTRYGVAESVGLELRYRSCDLCGAQPAEGKPAHAIDHDHETGAVRGVLCRSCNTSLGAVEGRMGGIERVTHYIQRGADYRDVDR